VVGLGSFSTQEPFGMNSVLGNWSTGSDWMLWVDHGVPWRTYPLAGVVVCLERFFTASLFHAFVRDCR